MFVWDQRNYLLNLRIDLKEHEGAHDDSRTWRYCDVQQHVLPNRIVLAVTPCQRNHRNSDRKDLSRFNSLQLEVDGHRAVLRDGD